MFAHTPPAKSDPSKIENWHGLVDHLQNVAKLAKEHAIAYGPDVAEYIGLLHDIGKAHPDFQAYLARAAAGLHIQRGSVDHKTAGAHYLYALGHEKTFALPILAHHGGFPAMSDASGILRDYAKSPHQLPSEITKLLTTHKKLTYPDWARTHTDKEFFLRMILSALIDADYLDTEAHFSAQKKNLRLTSTTQVQWAQLMDRTDTYRKTRTGNQSAWTKSVRETAYTSALEAATGNQGVYSLPIPTGGGKTIASMAFAIRHAITHPTIKRIIVVVPYISIIQQTAAVYREMLEQAGESFILEHHSATTDSNPNHWSRLASENWNAQIIITTAVQFFESLASNTPNRIRKIHNITDSIVIIDELQALPIIFMDTIADFLRSLALHYRTTIVLSTATQPAFDALAPWKNTIITPIIHPTTTTRWFADDKRVLYQIVGAKTWAEIAASMQTHNQALAIVNTKESARAIYHELPQSASTYHLSTAMCGEHRRRTIDSICHNLRDNKRCHVVATQLIEAGVDIDFPAVYRALASLPSIAQAAGRCNRNGNRAVPGVMTIFQPADSVKIPPSIQNTIHPTLRVLARQDQIQTITPAMIRAYYQCHFERANIADEKNIQENRGRLNFAYVEENLRIVDDKEDVSVIITSYGTPQQQAHIRQLILRLQALPNQPTTNDFHVLRAIMRQIQPWIVTIRKKDYEQAVKQNHVQPVAPAIAPDLFEWSGHYDMKLGIIV